MFVSRVDGTAINLRNDTVFDNSNIRLIGSIFQELSFENDNTTSSLILNSSRSSINDAPTANNDEAIISGEDSKLNIGILENDLDVDGDDITVIQTSNPLNGTAAINENNNTLTYNPDPNFNGNDTFSYQISDGHNGTDVGVVRVNVESVNDVPIANNDTFVTKEDVAPEPLDVVTNDRDVDLEDRLSTTNIITSSSNGSAKINSNGTISYSPEPNFNGNDTFSYQISDGHNGTDVGVVRVNVESVNDPPIANDDYNITDEDMEISNFFVLSNDRDVDREDNIHIIGVTQPPNGTSSFSNHTVSYRPDPNINGNYTFTYIIADKYNVTDEGKVTIQVKPVNDPPIAGNDTAETFEDIPLVINVLQNVSDVDSNLTSLQVRDVSTYNATKGNVTVNADNTITYTPTSGYPKDLLKYTVFDEYGDSDIGNVTVTVMNVLESVNKYLHDDFSVSNRTRTFLTINVDPLIQQGNPKTVVGISGKLAYLKDGSGIDGIPINIRIEKNRIQADKFELYDLFYDIIKGGDIRAPQPQTMQPDKIDNGTFILDEPISVERGNHSVDAYPVDDTYNDLRVSASFVVERPPLASSDVVAYLIAILTLIGIGIGALKILPQYVNKKKQKKLVSLYMDKIKDTTDEIELKDIKEAILDQLLKNRISKEHYDLLKEEIDSL